MAGSALARCQAERELCICSSSRIPEVYLFCGSTVLVVLIHRGRLTIPLCLFITVVLLFVK